MVVFLDDHKKNKIIILIVINQYFVYVKYKINLNHVKFFHIYLEKIQYVGISRFDLTWEISTLDHVKIHQNMGHNKIHFILFFVQIVLVQ